MSCETCDHTMQRVAVALWWCPRCGTLGAEDIGDTYAPALVERCRAYEGGLRREPRPEHSGLSIFDGLRTAWRILGIAEAIHPHERPPA